jgi:hypothetical protein
VRAAIAEFSMSAPEDIEYTNTTFAWPVAANEASSPRINATTTSTSNTTIDNPPNVSALRDGRRNKFRTP